MISNIPSIEHKLVIVDDKGCSRLLEGEPEAKRSPHPIENILPSYLGMGWRVANMTSFSGSGAVLVLLHREVNVAGRT